MGIDGLMRRAVFLDRDGVLNIATVKKGKPYPPTGLAALELVPGVEAGLAMLKAKGFKLFCVTNQPDVARGTKTRQEVEAINASLMRRLPLDEVVVCFHDNADNCACRKPRPGMLLALAGKYDIDLAASYMVGDRTGDVLAGREAGCRTIFLDYGYDEPKPVDAADHVVAADGQDFWGTVAEMIS